MASHRKYTPPPAPVPEVKIDGTATAPDLALSVDIPDDAAHEYQKEIATADEVTVRLRKQLDDIKKSEEYQRQRQAAAMQPSPDQVLQFWKHNGLGESAEQFLLTHPQHIVGLTDFASRQAIQQGHQPGSAAHTEAAKEIFHDNLERLEAQTAADPAPAPQPFPRSSPEPLPPEPPERNSHYSAPPSRGEIGGYREPTLSSVKLSAEERQIAAVSGISEVQYAKNKLEMMRRQRAGELQK